MAEVDYGYGDDMDYGYGEPDPEPEPKSIVNDEADATTIRRPKRRCSVTKFSLPEETPLNAASIINEMRSGMTVGAPNMDIEEPSLVTEDKDINARGGGGGEELGDAVQEPAVRNAPGRQKSGVMRFLKRR